MPEPSDNRRRQESGSARLSTGPGSRWLFLAPALALMVGILIGAAAMRTAGDGARDGAATDTAPTATGDPTGGPAGTAPPAPTADASGRTIFIPASCEEGLDRAQAAFDTADDAVQALRHLQTARLQELLDRLQQAQAEVNTLATACRQQARVPD
ncbi:MAG TPA: hypothetical protein VJ777_29290 [Mycobacterium sp.]|nr:hypothetical protein [Mycobacterium sp.]